VLRRFNATGLWVAAALAAGPALADDAPSTWAALWADRLSVHFQSTVATQWHPDFASPYAGANSMQSYAEQQTAFISSLYTDLRVGPETDVVFDPELSGGKGLSKSLGVAAFPSGVVYRVGNPAPTFYLARLFLRHVFDLGGGHEDVKEGPNQVRATRGRDRLTVMVGRFAVTDLFDRNAFSSDPFTQFFDWALFASGAWDYPADTRGYTWGAMADLTLGPWSFRAGMALEPQYANLETLEWDITKARGLMAEGERRYEWRGYPGTVRVLAFVNQARMGSYRAVLVDPSAFNNNVAATRADGRTKYGGAISIDQRFDKSWGAFVRASFNDGANESWAFTEVDRCLALGVVHDGSAWKRPGDEVGGAVVVSGLSGLHRQYLAGGGYGFIIGDGQLNYGFETEGDFYYRAQVSEWLQVSAIYQPVINPAYNQDRGPIHIFTVRVHAAF